MARRGVAYGILFLLATTSLTVFVSPLPIDESEQEQLWTMRGAFDGFHASVSSDIWNETPWQNIAYPEGFDLLSVIDYSDVGVLINNNSQASRTIGWAFVNARNISLDRVFIFNDSATPTGETINRNQFNTYFAEPFLQMLANRSLTLDLNYLVTTKGVPLRINGGADKASFDQELALLGGMYNSSIGGNNWVQHGYGPLAGKEMEAFSRAKYGFYLVTRLTGYTVDTALGLIEKANNSLGQRGTYVLDLATNRNSSGYRYWNNDLYTANTTLNASMGLPTYFDEETEFITNISNVMGYASWGSNDGNWNTNRLPNSGFDSADSSYMTGSRYWYNDSLALAAGESFNWSYQTAFKRNGNGAMSLTIDTECSGEDGEAVNGLLGEYFDNKGVSVNTAGMPDLSGRIPDLVRLESTLDWSSRSAAFPGLDNRFRFEWSARYSGAVSIPESGNWTFYINSDDGSELWIDHQSIVQNHGVHGMRERSSTIWLDAGMHDLRVELFETGSVHGMQLFYEGPNQTKAIIPASALQPASGGEVSEDDLIHAWDFEEGSGSAAYDSVGDANLTLYGMNSSNWVDCAEGKCLSFDGQNDYAKVDVNDWAGNFSVSQFVRLNGSQVSYASSFAVGDVAGSNVSFQHAVISDKWQLHNNQTRTFGDTEEGEWTHLATVFANGSVLQYMNGILVNSNTMPTGSLNNIDVYKIGVNRAGSSYLKGEIDSIKVYDVALSASQIQTLSRDVLKNCSAYSGAGIEDTSVSQDFDFPADHEGHAWILYTYAASKGVGGQYQLVVEAFDDNGTLVSTNYSSKQDFSSQWNSRTVRFRPHENASSFTVSTHIFPTGDAGQGTYYLDTMSLRNIRPHMGWVNGSIAETAVSTGGRSFTWGTGYGQSLVADILEDGVSGLKGYVYEPYLSAVGYPSVLLPTYAQGYNFAESQYAANRFSSWMGVMVGDPKMAPYADIFHDVDLIDARVVGNVSKGYPAVVEMAVQNLGMSAANGTIVITDKQGSTVLAQVNVTLPAGDQVDSRVILNATFIPEKTSWMDLRIRYYNATGSPERVHDNDILELRLWSNEPPVVDDLFCETNQFSRGGTYLCTVEASDDFAIESVELEWLVIGEGVNFSNGYPVRQGMGEVFNQSKWQTTISISTESNLGWLNLTALVKDVSGIISTLSIQTIEVVDAPATWFGPHVSTVDSDDWSGANILPFKPLNGGLMRGEVYLLKACVMDADHDNESQVPMIYAARGEVGPVTYAGELGGGHHCYVSEYELAIGGTLDDVELELRDSEGDLMRQRQIAVLDRAPQVSLEVWNSQGLADRVVGDGSEYVVVSISDYDDPNSSATGDLSITWPGAGEQTYPLDFSPTQQNMTIQLGSPATALEGGNLQVSAQIQAKHSATNSSSLSIPFILTPPSVVEYSICDENGPVDALNFGQTATISLLVSSDRPLDSISATISQFSWSTSAPEIPSPIWQGEIAGCVQGPGVHYFRLKLDSSFANGEGHVSYVVKDIDGLSKSDTFSLEFLHSPPVVELYAPDFARPGNDLTLDATVSDFDGLEDVECDFLIMHGEDVLAELKALQTGYPLDTFETSMVYPVREFLANETINVSFYCLDSTDGFDNMTLEVQIEPTPPCLENCSTNSTTDQGEANSGDPTLNYLVPMLAVLGLVLLGVLVLVLRKSKPDLEKESIDWLVESQGQSQSLSSSLDDLFETSDDDSIFESVMHQAVIPPELELPNGWTVEQFKAWLEAGLPEGWTEEVWIPYRDAKLAIISQL